MLEKRIILNRIKTPDGTILTSYHRHDYKEYRDTISHELYLVDGGLDYLRRTVNITEYEEMSLYNDETIDVVRENLYWGTYGKNGKEELKYIRLCDMSDDHIINILNSDMKIDEMYKDYFWLELKYRKENKISIKD